MAARRWLELSAGGLLYNPWMCTRRVLLAWLASETAPVQPLNLRHPHTHLWRWRLMASALSGNQIPQALLDEVAAHVRRANELAVRSTRGVPVSGRERLAVQQHKIELLRRICQQTPSEHATAALVEAERNLDGIRRTGCAYTPWPTLHSPGVQTVRGRSL